MFLGACAVGVVKRDARLARDVGELREGSFCSEERDTERTTRHHGGNEDAEQGLFSSVPPFLRGGELHRALPL
jgi:hypothetical protein